MERPCVGLVDYWSVNLRGTGLERTRKEQLMTKISSHPIGNPIGLFSTAVLDLPLLADARMSCVDATICLLFTCGGLTPASKVLGRDVSILRR